MMDCAAKKDLRDKLPQYGALGGLVVAGYLWKSKSFPNWNIVEALAGTATLGYLGGFLAVPLVKKCSPAEIEGVVGIDDVSSVTDEYAGYGSTLAPAKEPTPQWVWALGGAALAVAVLK